MTNQVEAKHDLYVGRCEDGKLLYSKHAGAAFQTSGAPFFTLRLHMFPGVSYFLSKNHGDGGSYTLFSKIVRDDDGTRFQNPVGFARLRTDLKTHLEVSLNLLERRIYMSLFPA